MFCVGQARLGTDIPAKRASWKLCAHYIFKYRKSFRQTLIYCKIKRGLTQLLKKSTIRKAPINRFRQCSVQNQTTFSNSHALSGSDRH